MFSQHIVGQMASGNIRKRLRNFRDESYEEEGRRLRREAALELPYRSMLANTAQYKRRRTLMGPSVARSRGAIVSGEMKYIDSWGAGVVQDCGTNWVGTGFDPNRTVDIGGGAAVLNPLCLFAPTVGAGVSQRIGKKCHMMKVKINYSLTVAAQAAQNAGDPATSIRIIVVLDKQTNKSQMLPEQLMQATTGGSGIALMTFQNVNNFGRFQVLRDKTIVLESPTLTQLSTGNVIQSGLNYYGKMSYKWSVPLGVRFDTGTGTAADIIDNSLHVIAATAQNGLPVTFGYNCRVSFKE